MGKNGRKLAEKNHNFSPNPLADRRIEERRLLFSFRYFDHSCLHEIFGLGQAVAQWYVSLLDRLKNLERMDCSLEELCSGIRINNNHSLRFHLIDWAARNIPINKDDLDWIPKEIRENEVEFPFYQLSISTGKGRIVGFCNKNIFFIVLLDHNHNIQPSNYSNYTVRPTTMGLSEYDDLVSLCHKEGYDISSLSSTQNVLYHYVDDDLYADLQKSKYSLNELLQYGLYYECDLLPKKT